MSNQLFQATQGKLRFAICEDSFAIYCNDYLLFKLMVNCAVEKYQGSGKDQDDGQYIFSCENQTSFRWLGKSSQWEEKEYHLELNEHGFIFRVKVKGHGALGRVKYFQGSEYEFSRYFIPNPLGGEKELPQYHSPVQDGSIAMQYHTPPLLAFPFEFESKGWLALGLAPQPGSYNLETFDYCYSSDNSCSLATDYIGYTRCDGELEVAAISGTFGKDEYDALGEYAAMLYDCCGCVRKDWSRSPRWWYGPFFCGWGEQETLNPHDQFSAATQKNYTWMSNKLDELELKPTAIIIDDKWQATYGEAEPDPDKWPNMRAFTDMEHQKGRKVILWFKTWNHEGLDTEECVQWYSLPQGADPTSPRYRQRIEETFYRLLSADAGCCNCDGFKVDFANVMPLGPNLSSHGGIYGLELLKCYLKLIYDTAKSINPDCLINNSCSHPYFAEVTDQCRLHDYFQGQRSAQRVMNYRYKLHQAAMPGVLIDTDTVRSTYQETLHYIKNCGKIGAPNLYFLTGTQKVPFDKSLHDALKQSWQDYSTTVQSKI